MKRFTLAFSALLAIGLSVAIAQNLNKSVQQSQDPTGVIGMDATNNVWFPRHLGNRGSAPTVAAGCGSGGAVVGSDFSGTVTEGTGNVIGCQIAFRAAFGSSETVHCVIALKTGNTASPISWSVSAAGFHVTHAQAATSMPYSYYCSGNLP